MEKEEQFKEMLRAGGERVTAPRVGVFRVLARYGPVGMPKLLARAREDGIDTVTVYRTVDLFRKLGLVQEMGLGRNRLLELSDDYQGHHHHFMCVRCGKIFDFDSGVIEAELRRAGAAAGFEMRGHQVEVTGVCEACRKNEV